MRKANSITKQLVPDIQIVIGYKDIYDDYDSVDLNLILKEIPSFAVINFIVKQFNKVIYSGNNEWMQRQQIRDFCKFVPTNVRKRIWGFTKKNLKSLMYEMYGCSMAIGFCLQNFVPFGQDDNCFELCEGEMEQVFKLILYCNQRWTDAQTDGGVQKNIIDVLIKFDMPIVEFKLYKNFKFQIYKAILFFNFMENEVHYKAILSDFCKDKNVSCWQEYIGKLFNFYASSLKGHFIKVDTNYIGDNVFFKQYCVDLNDCTNLWDDHNALNYLRNHFLVDCGNKNYLLLNTNLLVDKLYQGMRFDLYRTIEKHGAKNKRGKKYKSFSDFSSEIGSFFSEPQLLYALIEKTFVGQYSKLFTGGELKAKSVIAEPDLYMRVGSVLYLFEFKDATLGDCYKYSNDIEEIKKAICDRICRLDNEKRKGVGQLYYTIDQIVNHGVMNALDIDVKSIKTIVPIVVTTDRAFSALGVEALVAREYAGYPQIGFSGYIFVPIVVDLDTLIDLSYRLHMGLLNFLAVVQDYRLNNQLMITPFSTFIYDKYKRPRNSVSQEEIKYLFADAIRYMSIY